MLSACQGSDDKQSTEGKPDAPKVTEDARSRIAEAIVDAQRGMNELTDYTFRGPYHLPKESNPLFGHDTVATVKATADGRCETTITFEDVGDVIRRSIDGTTYQQFSDQFMANAPTDEATMNMLRGHWTAAPDDSSTATCDLNYLSRSFDLSTARELGSAVIRGEDVVGFAGHAATDTRVKVRVWMTTGAHARVIRISGGTGDVGSTMTLVSVNDGFSIDKPPADLVLRQ